MILKVIQTAIVLAVVYADIYFEWGSRGYAAPAVGIFLAFVLTTGPLMLIDWVRDRRARKLTSP